VKKANKEKRPVNRLELKLTRTEEIRYGTGWGLPVLEGGKKRRSRDGRGSVSSIIINYVIKGR